MCAAVLGVSTHVRAYLCVLACAAMLSVSAHVSVCVCLRVLPC